MKKTTCRDLRGACDAEIVGATPEEMGDNCKAHVMDMLQAGDEAHTAAVEDMKELAPEDQKKWYEEFVSRFDGLPDA